MDEFWLDIEEIVFPDTGLLLVDVANIQIFSEEEVVKGPDFSALSRGASLKTFQVCTAE